MDSKEIKVTFETITPLYTGDAWQEFKEIRPSSLIGSLRFWFEVICYFGGVCSKEEFNNEQGRFERIVDSDTGKSENGIKNEKFKKLLLKHGTDFYGQIEALKEFKIPVPAIIFGTTGWKGLIEINGVKPIKDYYFGNKLNLQYKFFVSKNGNQEIKEGKDYDKKSNSYKVCI